MRIVLLLARYVRLFINAVAANQDRASYCPIASSELMNKQMFTNRKFVNEKGDFAYQLRCYKY